jgi:hypothetical protein
MLDQELTTLMKCVELIGELNSEAQARITNYLSSKFEGELPLIQAKSAADTSATAKESKSSEGGAAVATASKPAVDKQIFRKLEDNEHLRIEDFSNSADLFKVAKPKRAHEKALVVAAFLTVKQGLKELKSSDIQKGLRDVDKGLQNITNVITRLQTNKPKLMVQTRKAGETQQARKRFKVTQEGLDMVEAMLN